MVWEIYTLKGLAFAVLSALAFPITVIVFPLYAAFALHKWFFLLVMYGGMGLLGLLNSLSSSKQ